MLGSVALDGIRETPEDKITMEKLNGVSSVVLEGSFIKSPPQSKLENRSSWHERYFALVRLTCHVNKIHSPTRKGPKKLEGLKDFYLVYWEKKSDRKNGRRPIRLFPILSGDRVEKQVHPIWSQDYPHVLTVHTKKRTFYLCAESETQQKLWYDVMNQILLADYTTEFEKSQLLKNDPMYETLRDCVLDYHNNDDTSSSSSSSDSASVTRVSRSPFARFRSRLHTTNNATSRPILRSKPRSESLQEPKNSSENDYEVMTAARPNSADEYLFHEKQAVPHNVAKPTDIDFKRIHFYDLFIDVPMDANVNITRDRLQVKTKKGEVVITSESVTNKTF